MNIDNVNLQFSNNSNYILTIDRYPDMPFYVSSIAMPDVNLGITEFESPFGIIRRAGTSLSFSDIILTFYVDEDLTNYKTLLGWMLSLKELNPNDNAIAMSEAMRTNKPEEKYCNCTITFLNTEKKPMLNITYEDCFPTSLSGLLLSSASQQEYNTCDLTLTFTNHEFKNA